jgi:hypothetical protein
MSGWVEFVPIWPSKAHAVNIPVAAPMLGYVGSRSLLIAAHSSNLAIHLLAIESTLGLQDCAPTDERRRMSAHQERATAQ